MKNSMLISGAVLMVAAPLFDIAVNQDGHHFVPGGKFVLFLLALAGILLACGIVKELAALKRRPPADG